MLLTLLLTWINTCVGLRKVIVVSLYHEYDDGNFPEWMTSSAIKQQYGYETIVYQKTNSSAPNYVPINRGGEGAVYLRYIVEYYDNFPDVAIFVHAKPHEHQIKWLEMVGCISPNASYININLENNHRRSPDFWGPIAIWVEQCWRDVLQTALDLRNNSAEFLRLVPPSIPLEVNFVAAQQFILSRDMVKRRPLRVWKELLNIIGEQSACHLGELDYDNLYLYLTDVNKTKVGPEPSEFSNYTVSTVRGDRIDIPGKGYGRHTQGGAAEHLAHVIYGSKPIYNMTFPNMQEICSNFLPNCRGSPCIDYKNIGNLIDLRFVNVTSLRSYIKQSNKVFEGHCLNACMLRFAGGSDKNYYLFLDAVLYPLANSLTVEALGFEWGDTNYVLSRDFQQFPVALPIEVNVNLLYQVSTSFHEIGSNNNTYEFLRNKTFHFMGNSVSRSWAFALLSIVAGKEETRSTQKVLCGGGNGMSEGESCDLNVLWMQLKIKFTWIQQIYSNVLKTALLVPADFRILSVGSHYIFEKITQKVMINETALITQVLTETRKLSDFVAAVCTVPIWFRLNTFLCVDKLPPQYRQQYRMCNDYMLKVNNAIVQELRELGGELFQILDTWRNDTEVCGMYDDHVHSQQLALLQINKLLLANIKNNTGFVANITRSATSYCTTHPAERSSRSRRRY